MWTESTYLGIVFGQILSLLITSVGLIFFRFANKGVDSPFSQCFLNYVLLALVYGAIFLHRKEPLKAKYYLFILLGLVDVLAKFHVVIAYQDTTVTSIMLLDCWIIPCVLFLTWLFFKTKCELRKVVGTIICVAGLVNFVFSDVHSADRSSGSNLAIIVGATLYGVITIYKGIQTQCCSLRTFMSWDARICRRFSLKLIAWNSWPGWAITTLFSIFSQYASRYTYESNEYKSLVSSPGMVFLYMGFSLAIFLFYLGVPLLLKISGSTMLNLSLFTSNMWVVLIRIFEYHEKVNWIYFVAFVAVTLGLIIYLGGDEMDPNNVEDIVDPNNGEVAEIDDEIGLDVVAAADDGGGLGHSENVEISNNDESMISFRGTGNSSRRIIINIQVRNVH